MHLQTPDQWQRGIRQASGRSSLWKWTILLCTDCREHALIWKMSWEHLPLCWGVKTGTRSIRYHQQADLNKSLPWTLSCHPTDKRQSIKSTFHLDPCQNWLGQKRPFWFSWTMITLGDERIVIVKLNSPSCLFFRQPSSVFMTKALKQEEFCSRWTRKEWPSKKGSCVGKFMYHPVTNEEDGVSSCLGARKTNKSDNTSPNTGHWCRDGLANLQSQFIWKGAILNGSRAPWEPWIQ